MSTEKVYKSFEEWQKSEEVFHTAFASFCKRAWDVCAKMKDVEIDELVKEIEELKKKHGESVEVIRFYADKNNWESISGHTKFMSNLKVEDCAFLNCGGGRARAFLKGVL